MPSEPFQTTYSDSRTIEIPTGLDADVRKRFVARINEAVAQQIELSRKCDAVLKLTREVRKEGERLIISHEPAAAANPGAIVNDESRPDIQTLWWLTWSTARALQAASEQNVTHGGIQFACVYRDEAGRVKLGDFGIAQAFETVCGIDGRRYVACTSEPQADPSGRKLSGVWSLLDEQTGRDYGWIAPYFGHELLEAPLRLNPKSDQFALGALLFLWATGYHPYDVELSDPNQMILFQLEPRPLKDERPDWADAFQRAETEVQTAADQIIISWRDLTNKLLASEPKQRFESLSECVETIAKHADEKSWSAASEAISQANALLDAGDVGGFLEKLAPYSEGNSLPALWHDRLAGYVQHAEAQKEVIARRKALEQRLREGNKALERQEVDKARAIAQEISDAPDSDDELRSSADALLALCDEHEARTVAWAAEQARVNIEQAGEAIERNDLADARQRAESVKQDPSAPEQLKAEADELLTQIAEAEQRVSGYLAELTQATVERREGQLESARERINALLTDERLPESFATQARLLLKDLELVEGKHLRFAKRLDDAQAALERIDAAAARVLLDELADEKLPDEMVARRSGMLEQLATLTRVLDMRDSAETLLVENGKPAEARTAAKEALGVADIPAALQSELQELIPRCEAAIAEAEKAAREGALAALKQAESRLKELNFDGCRELLKKAVLPFDGLPEDDRRRAEALDSSCEAAVSASRAFDQTQAHIDERDFDAAAAVLSEAPTADLPAKLAARAGELIAQIEKAREKFVEEQRAKLQSQIDQAATAADSGEITQADERLHKAEQSPYLTDPLREAIGVVRGKVEKFRPVLDTLGAAESALAQGNLQRARKLAAELPRDIDWVASRAAHLEQRVDEAEAAAREAELAVVEAALAAVKKALAAAETALIRVDPAAALKLIEGVAADLSLDESLKSRADSVTAEAKKQQSWLPDVEALDQLVQRGELDKVYRNSNALLKKDGIPKPIAKRVGAIADDAKKRIAARQEEIKAELAAIAAENEKRKYRDQRLEVRLEAIISDSFAANVQKDQAKELLGQIRGKNPRPPRWRKIAIGVSAVGVVAVIIYITDPLRLWSSFVPDKLQQLAVDEAAKYPGTTKPFALVVEPEGSWDGELKVVIDGGKPVKLGQLSNGEPPEGWLSELIPKLKEPPDGPNPRIIEQKIRAAAKVAYGERHLEFELEFADPQLPDSEAFLIVVGDTGRQPLGRLADGELPKEGLKKAVGYLEPPDGPTPSEVDVFNTAVVVALTDSGVTFDDVTVNDLTLRASYGQNDVVLVPLEMKYEQDSFTRQADAVAEHFASQGRALDRLAQAPQVSVKLDGADDAFGEYEERVAFVEDADPAKPKPADDDPESVVYEVSARLEGDNRAEGAFILSGALAEGSSGTLADAILTADKAGRTAFGKYLVTLKDDTVTDAPTGIGKWLFPTGVTPGAVRQLGDTVKFDVTRQGFAGRATLNYKWNPESLAFELDEAEAKSEIREWIKPLITAAALDSSWTNLLVQVAPADNAVGADYLQSAKLVSVSPGDEQPDDSPFSRNVTLVVGPATDPSDVRNLQRLPWRVNLEASGFVFDAPTVDEVKVAIEQEVNNKSADTKFRDARAVDAVNAFAPDSSHPPQIDTSQSPITVTTTFTRAGRREKFRGTWNDIKMGFVGNLSVVPRLDALASKSQPLHSDEIDDFVDALRKVTDEKSTIYGGGYKTHPTRFDAPTQDVLIDISESLQTLITHRLPPKPVPSDIPFPLVFIEYFVQDGEAYALAWIAGISDPSSEIFSHVEEMRVWRITELPKMNAGVYDAQSMEEYYTRYTKGPLVGNDLLKIIPPDIKASPNGTWGVVVAPSGPLWAVRWSEVQFDVRTINPDQKIEWLDPPASTPNPPVTTLDHLGEVLGEKAQQPRLKGPTFRRSGIWSVPCLAGTFGRLKGSKRLELGELKQFELSLIGLSPRSGNFSALLLTPPRGENGGFDATAWNSMIKNATARQVHKSLFGQQFWRLEKTRDMGVWNVGPIQHLRP